MDIDKKRNISTLIKHDLKKVFLPVTAMVIYIIVMSIFVGEVCPSKLLIGIPCAGCGMVRAFVLLLTFNFKQAFYMNPGIYAVLVSLITLIIQRYFLNTDIKYIKINVMICLIIILIIYTVKMVFLFGRQPLVLYKDALIFKIISMGD